MALVDLQAALLAEFNARGAAGTFHDHDWCDDPHQGTWPGMPSWQELMKLLPRHEWYMLMMNALVRCPHALQRQGIQQVPPPHVLSCTHDYYMILKHLDCYYALRGWQDDFLLETSWIFWDIQPVVMKSVLMTVFTPVDQDA